MTSASKSDMHVGKTDFKSAFRHCPVAPEHYRYSGVLLSDPESGRAYVAHQKAMPFGAIASVYAWDRVGAAVTAILRHFLGAAVLRYVDDLFWALLSGRVPSSREATFAAALRADIVRVVEALG